MCTRSSHIEAPIHGSLTILHIEDYSLILMQHIGSGLPVSIPGSIPFNRLLFCCIHNLRCVAQGCVENGKAVSMC